MGINGHTNMQKRIQSHQHISNNAHTHTLTHTDTHTLTPMLTHMNMHMHPDPPTLTHTDPHVATRTPYNSDTDTGQGLSLTRYVIMCVADGPDMIFGSLLHNRM